MDGQRRTAKFSTFLWTHTLHTFKMLLATCRKLPYRCWKDAMNPKFYLRKIQDSCIQHCSVTLITYTASLYKCSLIWVNINLLKHFQKRFTHSVSHETHCASISIKVDMRHGVLIIDIVISVKSLKAIDGRGCGTT